VRKILFDVFMTLFFVGREREREQSLVRKILFDALSGIRLTLPDSNMMLDGAGKYWRNAVTNLKWLVLRLIGTEEGYRKEGRKRARRRKSVLIRMVRIVVKGDQALLRRSFTGRGCLAGIGY